jgi:hypothetical protein
LIEVDYALGRALDQGIRDALARIGGKVVGVSRHPLGTADFSSFLLQAQSFGAPVIVLLNGGADAVNALKQASEFQIGKDGKQTFASLAMLISDVKAIGLKEAQGLRITESFYWDLDDLLGPRRSLACVVSALRRQNERFDAVDDSSRRIQCCASLLESRGGGRIESNGRGYRSHACPTC